MMMALRNSPSNNALIHALDGRRPPRKWSRAASLAIGASVCLHLGLLAYLYEQRTSFTPAQTPETPAISIGWVALPPKAPVVPPPPQHALVVHRAATTPTTTTSTTPLAPTNPQTVVADNGPPKIGLNVTPHTTPARMIVDPQWLSRPTATELSRYYPERAIDLGLTGRATLLCGVVASGKLVDCRVIDETPASAKFGEAALKLAGFFRMTPRTIDGQPVDGGLTRISLAFNLTDGD